MNKFISTFIIFILSLGNINSVYIKNSLEKTLMRYESMKEVMFKAKNNGSEELPYLLELVNIQAIGQTIQKGAQPIGFGRFGNVFKYDYRPSLSSMDTIQIAAKEIFFNNNYASEKGEEDQDMIEKEIKFNLILAQYDPYGLYFPKYYGAYDVTSYFKTLITSNTPTDIKKFLGGKSKSSKNVLIINMELLDLEMADYQQQILSNITKPYLHTRLKIGESIANALILFYDRYSHCDLKPKNIMAKKLNDEEIARLAEQGIDRIELYPGEFYQVKVIDFGVVAEGHSNTRKCNVGASAFTPPEFFLKGSHKNFDVFSLAMIMLDNELASIGNDFFSLVQDVWVDCLKYHMSITDEQSKALDSLPYSQMIDLYSTNTKYKTKFFKKLRENFPELDELISQKMDQKKPEEIKFNTIKYANPFLTKQIFITALEIYVENDFIQSKKEKNTELLKKYEMGYVDANEMDHDSEAYKMKMDRLSLMFNEKVINSEGSSLEKELILYCISQIKKSGNERDSIQQFVEKLQEIRIRFMEATGDSLKEALKLKRYYFAKQNEKLILRNKSIKSYEEFMKQKTPSFKLDEKFLVRI
jgi:serine/threonine protein kinase